MKAHIENLQNNRPEAYTTYTERKDFFEWMDAELKAKGHEVMWPAMSFFICNKFCVMERFPFNMFTDKKLKGYAKAGSDAVFHNSFPFLKQLYESETILKDEAALDWDKRMLHEEQFVWIHAVYETMDQKSTERMETIAKGKFIYGLFVPKAVRFEGDISDPKDRYEYALNKLYSYCKYHNV